MKSLRYATALLNLLLLPAANAAEPHHHPPSAPHQHGTADLNIAVEGRQVALELISPAHNLLGFEHPPRDAAQHARLAEVRRILTEGTALRFNEEAQCRLTAVDIESDLLENPGDHDDHPPSHKQTLTRGDGHSEFHVFYTYDCRHPQALSTLELGLWDLFDQLHELQGQAITAQGQRRLALQRGEPIRF